MTLLLALALVPWHVLDVGPMEFAKPQQQRFRDAPSFARFLHLSETGRFVVPHVDFARDEVVLFAIGPRSSPAYRLHVRRVDVSGGRTVVHVEERTPSLGSRAPAALTFPYVLVVLPRSDRPVAVEWPQAP